MGGGGGLGVWGGVISYLEARVVFGLSCLDSISMYIVYYCSFTHLYKCYTDFFDCIMSTTMVSFTSSYIYCFLLLLFH